jgi:hypothetical protein
VGEFIVITTAALALFVPFISIQYDTNGVVEAQAVETGDLFLDWLTCCSNP